MKENILGKNIIVNYHYVRDSEKTEFPQIKACPIARLEAQIKFLINLYEIVPLEKLYNQVQYGDGGGSFCVLAFDDGFLDHYENVLPILEKYNIVGTFFPITSTFEGRVPLHHKVHLLLKFPIEELIKNLGNFLSSHCPDLQQKCFVPSDFRLNPKRRFDDILTANFKEVIITLPIEIKEKFLNDCFNVFSINEQEASQKLFMRPEQVLKLKEAGMAIGCHTHNHYRLDTVGASAQRFEIKTSQSILEDLLNEKPIIFSYPNGRCDKNTKDILEAFGFKFALIIENRAVEKGDSPYLLPRYDTNDIKI